MGPIITALMLALGLSLSNPASYVPKIEKPKVLLVGDSQSLGEYGKTLDQLFRIKIGTGNVTTAALCGAHEKHFLYGDDSGCDPNKNDVVGWYKTSTQDDGQRTSFQLEQLIEENDPSLVVISLGTNYMSPRRVLNGRTKELLDTLNGRKCYWVGAPQLDIPPVRTGVINEHLRVMTQEACTYVDSTLLTDKKDILPDGIHYKKQPARRWAKRVFDTIIKYEKSISE
jgi:hypothetical protein